MRRSSFLLVILCLAASASVGGIDLEAIQNREWVAQDIGGLGVLDTPRSVVRFDEDGSIRGNGGCNDFFGEYRLDGQVLTVGPVGTTRKGCVPPEVMDQEQRFLAVFGSEPRLEKDGSDLLVFPGSGDPPTRLRNQDAATLSGTVDDGSGSELPADAAVTVGLYALSSQDGPAKLLGEVVLDSVERMPVPFELSYDVAEILESHNYVLQAWIRADGDVLYVTTDVIPVFRDGQGNEAIEVLVTKLGVDF